MRYTLPVVVFLCALVIGGFLSVAPLESAVAQVTNDLVKCGGPSAGEAQCTASHLNDIIVTIFELVINWVAPTLVLILVMVSGIQIMVTGGADPTSVTRAKNRIMWAIAGYVLILIAWVLVNQVVVWLNINVGGSGGWNVIPFGT